MAVPVNTKQPSKKSFSIESMLSLHFCRPVNCVMLSEKNEAKPTPEGARDSTRSKGKPKCIGFNTLNV